MECEDDRENGNDKQNNSNKMRGNDWGRTGKELKMGKSTKKVPESEL